MKETLERLGRVESFIRNASFEMSRLRLFSEYPEIKSFHLEVESEYNDQGGTYNYLNVCGLELDQTGLNTWASDYSEGDEYSLEDLLDDGYFLDYVAEKIDITSYFDASEFDGGDSIAVVNPGSEAIRNQLLSMERCLLQRLVPIRAYALMYKVFDHDDNGDKGMEIGSIYLNLADATNAEVILVDSLLSDYEGLDSNPMTKIEQVVLR